MSGPDAKMSGPNPQMSGIAVIAGAGALPAALAAELAQRGAAPLVCSPEHITPEGLAVDIGFRFERLAPFLRDLGDRGVTQVALAGAIPRSELDPSLFDRETASLVPAMIAAIKGGDDAALRWIMDLIEDFDLKVVGLNDLAPGLLVEEGQLSHRAATAAEIADAARGRAILEALAPVDVAQGAVVATGLCLGVEAIYGTDAMLANIAQNRPLREPQTGGVFVKRAKDGQDLRADLPTIGPTTIAAVSDAGLSALCLHAGHVVILDKPAVLAAADAANLALWAEP